MKRLAAALLASSTLAQAHEGHGLPGAAHWHASDAWGWLLLAALLAGAAWWAGRK